MKKLKLFSLLGLGLLSTFGILLGTVSKSNALPMYADPEVDEPAPVEDPVEDPEQPEEPGEEPAEVFECSVVLSETKHGDLTVDKKEGHVGDLVVIDAQADLLYLVKNVSVNGTALIEDEEIRGRFTFALVEGENVITASFVIDQELLGELSGMVDQAVNKDWTNLFSVRNLVVLVSFILNGGILIAIVRYFVRDKKLAKTVEKKVESTVKQVLPDATKQIVLDTIKDLIAPYFSKIEANSEDIQNMLVVFCRCFALMQENTPESRIAITKELASLKLSDKSMITAIEEKINDFIKQNSDKMAELLLKVNTMKEENKEIVAEAESESVIEQPVDDGTQI